MSVLGKCSAATFGFETQFANEWVLRWTGGGGVAQRRLKEGLPARVHRAERHVVSCDLCILMTYIFPQTFQSNPKAGLM